MALPILIQKLFSNFGGGDKLRPDIIPTTVNGVAGDANTGNIEVDTGVLTINGHKGDVTPEQTGCLSLKEGGNVEKSIYINNIGRIYTEDSQNKGLLLCGPKGWGDGGCMALRASDSPIEPGSFILSAGGDTAFLKGTTDGALTWANRPVLTLLESSWTDGTNWQRVYTDGFMEQLFYTDSKVWSGGVLQTLWRPYRDANYSVLTQAFVTGSDGAYWSTNIYNKTSSNFTLRNGSKYNCRYIIYTCGYI